LLAELLPAEEGFVRVSGENTEQFAEYHRSKRLAEAVKQTARRRGNPPDRGMNAATAAVEFASWLRDHDTTQQEPPEDLDELAFELADSWCINNIDAVFTTCSPHRVALSVQHVHGFYVTDFADQLVALLPEWIRWLDAINTTPAELAERCLPYAQGQPHPQITADHRNEPDYPARVTE
jgi:hypothetical protein